MYTEKKNIEKPCEPCVTCESKIFVKLLMFLRLMHKRALTREDYVCAYMHGDSTKNLIFSFKILKGFTMSMTCYSEKAYLKNTTIDVRHVSVNFKAEVFFHENLTLYKMA